MLHSLATTEQTSQKLRFQVQSWWEMTNEKYNWNIITWCHLKQETMLIFKINMLLLNIIDIQWYCCTAADENLHKWLRGNVYHVSQQTSFAYENNTKTLTCRANTFTQQFTNYCWEIIHIKTHNYQTVTSLIIWLKYHIQKLPSPHGVTMLTILLYILYSYKNTFIFWKVCVHEFNKAGLRPTHL